MKKIISALLCALLLCASGAFPAGAADAWTVTMRIGDPHMTVNGMETEIDPGLGTVPIVVHDRTLLPVRALMEAAGGTASWDGSRQQVTLTLGADSIVLTIGSDTAYWNDAPRTLDTAPEIRNGRTMLPIRFIAESFGFHVGWDGDQQLITITAPTASQTEPYENVMNLSEQITELESGLSAVSYSGDTLFHEFLAQGGAATDAELVRFLQSHIVRNAGELRLASNAFGCSAIAVKNDAGEALFGRNFDWYSSDALIVRSKPQNGYASISTVNTNFIRTAYGSFASLPEKARTLVSLYAPLDGMNEKGLVAAVLYIEDAAAIHQNTGKPDLTTTTAIRLLLDQAADVDEAVALLKQYDMHDSLGMMVHFALADASGRSVAVEYIGGEMVVTETPVITNFYLADGSKQGLGSSQSHTRFNTLTARLAQSPTMEMADVRDALSSVSKRHFNDGETTEWSIVYNQAQRVAQYYHRENYDKVYSFRVG